MQASGEMHSVVWGKERIGFRLRRSSRRTLGITVRPDMGVIVTAPRGAKIEAILGRVGKRAAWIQEQQRYFREFLPHVPPRRYVSGETHRYLGRQYRLKVIEGAEAGVALKGGFIRVSVATREPVRVRRLLEGWYLARARERFARYFEMGVKRMGTRLNGEPRLGVRRMSHRWGSWKRERGIWLNPELVKAPGSCIEYVVIHELCHLVHGHHGKDFYDLLRLVMPDWEQRKARLEQIGAETGVRTEVREL